MANKKVKVTETNKVRINLIKRGMNQAHFHYNITPERIKKMPAKAISEGEFRGKLKSKYFNPVYFYPEGVSLLHNEVGHDRVNRYTIKNI